MPQLDGLDEDAAKRALESIKLIVGQISQTYSETVPTGRVIVVLPEVRHGAEARRPVNLAISKGKKPIAVPDLTGKSVQEATRTLKKAGFAVGRTDQFDEKVPEGRVISQTPNTGTLFAKDKVQLVVSKGPPLVAVPNVRSKKLADAQKILTEAGFTVKVEKAPFNLGLNLVAGQNPGAGKKVKPGSTSSSPSSDLRLRGAGPPD